MKCEDCIEWEYFEGYGYGCFCMKTMSPIDANKCEFYADKRPDVPHSWKPSKTEPQESDLGDYPDAIHNQFDNMTGSMNLF